MVLWFYCLLISIFLSQLHSRNMERKNRQWMNAEGNVLTMKLGLSCIILHCTHLIFFLYLRKRRKKTEKNVQTFIQIFIRSYGLDAWEMELWAQAVCSVLWWSIGLGRFTATQRVSVLGPLHKHFGVRLINQRSTPRSVASARTRWQTNRRSIAKLRFGLIAHDVWENNQGHC